MNTAIIQFPGTNCDIDTYRVFIELLDVEATLIWHENTNDLEKYDAIILPGGFSYGDRLRAGIIAAYSPVIKQLKNCLLYTSPSPRD